MQTATWFLNRKVTVTVDRPVGSRHPEWGFVYPVNYGFLKGVFAPDGEDLDGYILGIEYPVPSFNGLCIAVLHRTNDQDDKLIVTSESQSLTDSEIRRLTYFQEKYFKSEIIR